MVKLVLPWFLTLLLGFFVFLFGKYLQRIEKERRDEFAALRKRSAGQSVSALSKMQPPDQEPEKGGIDSIRGQHQTSDWRH